MSGGVAAALGEVLDDLDDLPDGGQLVQATLFDGAGDLDAPSPLSAALKPKGKGRPPGAKNKRTQAVADWLLSMHRHPLAVMAEAYSMAPAEFLKAAGFQFDDGGREATKEERRQGDHGEPHTCYSNVLIMEAVKLQFRMAEAVAPYVAQRQPLAVQIGGAAGLAIHFEGVSLPARSGSAGNSGEVVDGSVVGGVRLPLLKSDGESRTDD